ncbi:MAG: hypothetical protein Q9208_007923 [Pyrenodesmia sp. 3 TL-2023]
MVRMKGQLDIRLRQASEVLRTLTDHGSGLEYLLVLIADMAKIPKDDNDIGTDVDIKIERTSTEEYQPGESQPQAMQSPAA